MEIVICWLKRVGLLPQHEVAEHHRAVGVSLRRRQLGDVGSDIETDGGWPQTVCQVYVGRTHLIYLQTGCRRSTAIGRQGAVGKASDIGVVDGQIDRQLIGKGCVILGVACYGGVGISLILQFADFEGAGCLGKRCPCMAGRHSHLGGYEAQLVISRQFADVESTSLQRPFTLAVTVGVVDVKFPQVTCEQSGDGCVLVGVPIVYHAFAVEISNVLKYLWYSHAGFLQMVIELLVRVQLE